MSTRNILVLSLFVAAIVFINECHGAPSCSSARHQVNEDECKYGTYVDWCRNTVCAKGPGQVCGGEWWENGKCGEGTYCACGYCSGCSVNLECWFGSFC